MFSSISPVQHADARLRGGYARWSVRFVLRHRHIRLTLSLCLSAAVCGNVFASPNPAQVRRGIDLVDSDAGCAIFLLVIYVSDEGIPERLLSSSKLNRREPVPR